MVKLLLVEDEMIIAEDMRLMLDEMGYNVIGSAMDYHEAIEILKSDKPDLILLDINLGGAPDGIDLAHTLNQRYQIPFVFTTSHTDSATLLRAKETNPINYLVKPFKKEQLHTAIEVALHNLASVELRDNPDNQEQGLLVRDAIFIKEKHRYIKIDVEHIQWIKADKNYLELHLDDHFKLIRSTLSGFLEKIGQPNFFRVHKSYAINLDYLTSLEPTQVIIGESAIPLARAYAKELLDKLDVY